MTLPASITRDPVYRKAVKLCQSISEHRFALAELAYEAREEKHFVDWGERQVWWSEIIALAHGQEIRRVQEWAQVGEFMATYKPKTTIYSRVSSAVRYQCIIESDKLVEMIDDVEGAYPTVEKLQSALAGIAYAETGYDAKRITNTLYRMANGGAKLIGLNGDLPEAIRADVEEAYRLNSNALQYMKERYANDNSK